MVVEKDTVFQRIAFSDWFKARYSQHVLILTAKGYPDFVTKGFVDQLLRSVIGIQFLYIGDADPHGADIFL